MSDKKARLEEVLPLILAGALPLALGDRSLPHNLNERVLSFLSLRGLLLLRCTSHGTLAAVQLFCRATLTHVKLRPSEKDKWILEHGEEKELEATKKRCGERAAFQVVFLSEHVLGLQHLIIEPELFEYHNGVDELVVAAISRNRATLEHVEIPACAQKATVFLALAECPQLQQFCFLVKYSGSTRETASPDDLLFDPGVVNSLLFHLVSRCHKLQSLELSVSTASGTEIVGIPALVRALSVQSLHTTLQHLHLVGLTLNATTIPILGKATRLTSLSLTEATLGRDYRVNQVDLSTW